jgi:hypothetical protein
LSSKLFVMPFASSLHSGGLIISDTPGRKSGPAITRQEDESRMVRRRISKPTLEDVARRSGVGTMTVSRVVNNSGWLVLKPRNEYAW